MRLESVLVSGFRSLALVGPIPLGAPTILTGHNDGGKTATLDAIGFLLGPYPLHNEDRSFLRAASTPTNSAEIEPCDPLPGAQEPLADGGERVDHTWVEGSFTLSPLEQSQLGLPEAARIRRSAFGNCSPVLEVFTRVPADLELRNLPGKKVADLRELAEKFSVPINKAPTNKQAWLDLLEQFSLERPQVDDWVTASPAVEERLPRLLRFGGEQTSVDTAVKTILNARYKGHLEDPDLNVRVRELEAELSERLQADATELCEHIKQRCPDLVHVEVLPTVSFSSGFKSAKLRLARTDGEAVAVDAAGAGRARRISLAVWEWASEILRNEAAAPASTLGAEPSPSPDHVQGENSDTPDETNSDVVIAYDEPDTHLDYFHQRRVMQLIREQCALPQVRMIIATHSMNLIDGVDISSIVHLTLVDDRTVMERLADDSGHQEVDRHLSDIATALGLRNSVLLHERLFVGVEGPTEQQALPVLFRLAVGMPLQSAGIALWACNNNEGALMFAKFLATHNRRVALVIDADSREKQKIFGDDKIKQYGLDPDKDRFMIGGDDRELEYLFSDEQWATAANGNWPRTDGNAWTPEMIAEKRQEKKFSDALLREFKTESMEGPQRKAEMVYDLVATLQRPEDVPEELRDVFTALINLANPPDA
ncbi:AAA family ATPase [Micromonospora chersina]|uniref:ATP-dependent nuclease n=1 Tax=Micromonospora chersina TaxID=47854 RepID=UPI003D93F97C